MYGISSSMLLKLYQLSLLGRGGACIYAFASFCGVNATCMPNFKLLAMSWVKRLTLCPAEPVWADLSAAVMTISAREKNEQEKMGRFSSYNLKENGQRKLHWEGTIWVKYWRKREREPCTKFGENHFRQKEQ